MLDRGNEERPIKMRHQACVSPDTKSQVYCFFVCFCVMLLSTIGYFKKNGRDVLQPVSKHQSIKSQDHGDQINAFTRGPGATLCGGKPMWLSGTGKVVDKGQGLVLDHQNHTYIFFIRSCCEITLIQSGNQKFALIQLSCESTLIQSECRLDDAKNATFGCINAMNLGSFQTDDLGIEMNTRSCSNKNGSMTSTHPVSFPQFCIAKAVNAFYDGFCTKIQRRLRW